MKIPVILNNKKTILDAEPQEKLLTVLRRLNLYSVKCGCENGFCGNCMILVDSKPMCSCTVTTGSIRNCQIETLESFKTNPIYTDIINGFTQAGMHLCGYCDAGKIFTAYELLVKYQHPSIEEIFSAIKNLGTCCTDRDTFTNGILYAVSNKHSREAKLNGKK